MFKSTNAQSPVKAKEANAAAAAMAAILGQ
jgi:hypothetical protein